MGRRSNNAPRCETSRRQRRRVLVQYTNCRHQRHCAPAVMAAASLLLSRWRQHASSWPLKPCGGCGGPPPLLAMYSRRSSSWRCAAK